MKRFEVDDPVLAAMLPELPAAWKHRVDEHANEVFESPNGTTVIASVDLDETDQSLWYHVSITHRGEKPGAMELAVVRRLFFAKGAVIRPIPAVLRKDVVHLETRVPDAIVQAAPTAE